MRREKVENKIEDLIITGMIMSDDCLRKICSIHAPEYFQGSFHGTIAGWCIDYQKRFNKAPKNHIQDIFERRGDRIDEDVKSLLGSFLSRLSVSYETDEAINSDYVLSEAQDYFKKRKADKLVGDLDDLEDPDEAIESYQKSSIDLQGTNFQDSLRTSTELLKERISKPKAIIHPWLRVSSLNMIFAERGLGKSWLSLILGVAMTREDFDEIEVGPWYVKNPSGCLYLDGEMGEYDLQDRIRQIAEPLGAESRRFPLVTFSGPDFTEKYNETPNITQKVWQDRLHQYLIENRNIRVLIIDNLASLCAGRDENDNQTASVLNLWFIRIRALGVAVVIVHHSGKSFGVQRGASALEDPLNNSILLFKPKDWVQGAGAHFGIKFTKARNDSGGEDYQTFSIRVAEHDNNPRWRTWGEV